MRRYIEADLFEQPGVIVVPTNTGKVHGAGLAKMARNAGVINDPARVFQLDVKAHWSDPADVEMIRTGLNRLVMEVTSNPLTRYSIPLVGIGHGEGDPEMIVPLIARAQAWCETRGGDLMIVLPTGAALARTLAHARGRARTDNTASILPRVVEILDAADSPEP